MARILASGMSDVTGGGERRGHRAPSDWTADRGRARWRRGDGGGSEASGPNRGGEVLAAPPGRPALARGVAGRASAPIRSRATLPPRERRLGAGLLRLPSDQPGERSHVPRGDSRRRGGGELLLVLRLSDEHARHVQAHRVHAGTARTDAGGPGCAAARLPAALQLRRPALRPATRGALPPRDGVPGGARAAGGTVFRRRRSASPSGRWMSSTASAPAANGTSPCPASTR